MKPTSLVVIILALFALAGCQPAATAPTATPVPAEPTEAPATSTATEVPTTETTTPVPSATSTEETTMNEESNSTADADVVNVRAVQSDAGTWTFHVTVRHPDTGWEDYANGWDVVTPDGTVLKTNPDDEFTRVLLHPHENEQPFTRSQSGLDIPEGVTQVTVRAHDIVDGFGGQEVVVDLTEETGENFEVERQQ